MAKNVFTATKRDILASFVTQSNVASHLDQTSEAHLSTTGFHAETYMRLTNLNLMTIQFEQDLITIQFKTQVRHTNVMFDEIFSTPSLQRVLTDVHVKSIGINQSYWTKQCFKIDSGACGNLMPLSMYKSLYNRVPSGTTVNSAICLLDYNKCEIKQLGTCVVSVKYRSGVKQVPSYAMCDKLKPILGMGDALALGLTSFHCPDYAVD